MPIRLGASSGTVSEAREFYYMQKQFADWNSTVAAARMAFSFMFFHLSPTRVNLVRQDFRPDRTGCHHELYTEEEKQRGKPYG
jgi:hypothetical protein